MKIDKTGMRFGKVVVQSLADPYISPKGVKLTSWLCLCDCGKEKVIVGCSLNKIKSCGCLVGDFHGHSKTDTYKAYCNMLERTRNEEIYPAYARKGINVSSEWLNSFNSFLEEMGERPSGKHSLDRIDPEGDYCKDNCRWVEDWGIQCYNKSLSDKSSTGVSGVSWSKAVNKWHSYINKDGKRIHLGYFEDFETAVEVRKRAELENYGFNLKEKEKQ